MYEVLRKLKERFSAQKSLELIRDSALFDESYYTSLDSGLTGNRHDLASHYATDGAAEGRDPHPLFSTSFYCENNPDVRNAGINPLAHFLACGAAEGRNPHPLFDTDFYLKTSGPIVGFSSNPLCHYLSAGVKEGLNPHPCFDTAYYLELNRDVAAAGINPLVHYVCFGRQEARNPHPLFDTTYYLSQNPRLENPQQSPLVHYLAHGARELLNPSPVFDTQYYLSQNPDVAAAGFNPLSHYLLLGESEGRRMHPEPFVDLSAEAIGSPAFRGTEFLSNQSKSKVITPAVQLKSKGSAERLAPLSVVVTTNNRPQMVADTIKECVLHAGEVELEFVVIDRGVKPDVFQQLKGLLKKHRNVVLQHIPDCKPGQARNLGASLTKHQIILFLNDDVKPLDDEFFLRHSQLHAKYQETNFAVIGRVYGQNGAPIYQPSLVAADGLVNGFAPAALQQPVLRQADAYQTTLSVKKAIAVDWLTDGFSNTFSIAAVEALEFIYRQTRNNRNFRIYEEASAIIVSMAQNTMQSHMKHQLEAGLMLTEFAGLYADGADFLHCEQLVQLLETPTLDKTELLLTDCMAVIEGIKAWCRILEQEENFGSQPWQTELIEAVLGMCLRQGFILGWTQPDANFQAAYMCLLNDFMECTRKIFEMAAVNGHRPLLAQLPINLQNPAKEPALPVPVFANA